MGVLFVPAALGALGTLPEQVPGRAVGVGVGLGQTLRRRRGQAHIREGRHGTGAAAQTAAQLLLALGKGQT